MPLILYHVETSVPGRSVALVAHTLGLTIEYKTVDVFQREQFSPEFLEINPLHTVPTIDDDGFILWESHAIMTYLVSKYGKDDSLYPKDLQKRAIVDQRLHLSNEVFRVLRNASEEMLFHGGTTLTAQDLTKIQDCQANIEKLLEGHEFMAGDTLTVADYSFITEVDVLEAFSPTENKFPNTKAWIQRCHSSIKDFQKVNQPGAERLMGILSDLLSS